MLPVAIGTVLLIFYICDFTCGLSCNVAYRRQTNQSSWYYETEMSNGYPCNAVDGLQSGSWFDGSCMHTLDETDNWWQIDLGDVYTVDFVNITVRTDNPVYNHYDKLGTIIHVSPSIDTNGDLVSAEICASGIVGPAEADRFDPFMIPCQPGTTGRYLRITRNIGSTTNQQLCEVEVYANLGICPPPSVSWSCRDLCYDKATNSNICPEITTESSVTTTAVATTAVVTTTSTAGNTPDASQCLCSCNNLGVYALNNITNEEMRAQLARIIEDISVDKDETALAKSKLTSAKDDRTSAKAVGSLGVVILIVVVAIIIVMDLDVYIRGFKTMKDMVTKENPTVKTDNNT